MNFLDNYIIDPSSKNLMFLELWEMVWNLYRRDFEVGYAIVKELHPRSEQRKPPPQKKKNILVARLRTPATTSRLINITVSDEDADRDLIGSQPPVTPLTTYSLLSLDPESNHESFDTSLLNLSTTLRRDIKTKA